MKPDNDEAMTPAETRALAHRIKEAAEELTWRLHPSTFSENMDDITYSATLTDIMSAMVELSAVLSNEGESGQLAVTRRKIVIEGVVKE